MKFQIFLNQGVLAGIVYNGLRPLDLAHDKSERTKIRGSVKSLTSIPYDYKERNPGLFIDTDIQSTAELYSHDGSGTIQSNFHLNLEEHGELW